MKRILVALAISAAPVLATPALACDLHYCAGTSIACGIVHCESTVKKTACYYLGWPEPAC